jgi:hypothetical protein
MLGFGVDGTAATGEVAIGTGAAAAGGVAAVAVATGFDVAAGGGGGEPPHAASIPERQRSPETTRMRVMSDLPLIPTARLPVWA